MILLFSIAMAISVVFYTLKTGISPSPTGKRVKRDLLSLLPEEVSGTVYDLGSGWGTLVLPIAKRYENQVVGYELSPLPHLVACARKLFQRRPNLSLRRHNFLSASLENAGLIVCYLYPRGMKKLEARLPRNVPIITHTFAIPGWKPDAIHTVRDLFRTKIYLYNFVQQPQQSATSTT